MPESLSIGVQIKPNKQTNQPNALEPKVTSCGLEWANGRDVYVLSHRSSSFVIVKPTKLESLEKMVMEFQTYLLAMIQLNEYETAP